MQCFKNHLRLTVRAAYSFHFVTLGVFRYKVIHLFISKAKQNSALPPVEEGLGFALVSHGCLPFSAPPASFLLPFSWFLNSSPLKCPRTFALRPTPRIGYLWLAACPIAVHLKIHEYFGSQFFIFLWLLWPSTFLFPPLVCLTGQGRIFGAGFYCS